MSISNGRPDASSLKRPSLRRLCSCAALAAVLVALSACDQTVVEEEATTLPTYSSEEISYFLDVAVESEYGSPRVVKKWDGDVRIRLGGSPTPADSAALADVVEELDELVGERHRVRLVGGAPGAEEVNVNVWYVPLDSMRAYEPNYRPGNWGYFYLRWDEAYRIRHANVLVASDAPTQAERAHLIREELTQSLGLMNDSERFPQSIFYEGASSVRAFTPLDRTIIEMLYRPEVEAGMGRSEAEAVFRGAHS